MPAYYPPGVTLDSDFSTGALPSGWTLTRNSTATDGLYTDAAGSSYNTFANNVARFRSGGLLFEGQPRTNLLLNSAAPATQTVSLTTTAPAGHVLWVIGTGSAAITAGTGTATGLGTATAGNPLFFTVTANGTFTITVTGALNRFQLEKGGCPSSFIVTTGATATRIAELCNAPTGAWFNAGGDGTLLVETIVPGTLTGVGGCGGALIDDGTSNNLVELRLTTTSGNLVVTTALVSQANLAMGSGLAVGTPYRQALRFSPSGGSFRGVASGTLSADQTGKTVASTLNRIGLWGGTPATLGATTIATRVQYWPTALSDSDLQIATGPNATYGVGALGPMQAFGNLAFPNFTSAQVTIPMLASASMMVTNNFSGAGRIGPMSGAGGFYQGMVGVARISLLAAGAGRQEELTTGKGLMSLQAAGIALRAQNLAGGGVFGAMQAAGVFFQAYSFHGGGRMTMQAQGVGVGIDPMSAHVIIGALTGKGNLILPPPPVNVPGVFPFAVAGPTGQVMVPPWPPSVVSQGQSIDPRTLSTKLRGDASEQIPDGINVWMTTSYQAQWDLPSWYSDQFMRFLRQNRGKVVQWVLPGETTARTFRIKSYQRSSPTNDQDTIQVEFIERPLLQ